MAVKLAEIRASLQEQIQAKGADVALYQDQIDSYCWLWKQVQDMQRDVKKNGLTVEAVSSTGKPYEKENPSVQNVLRYMQQMDRILTRLQLTPDNCPTEDDEL